MSRLLRTNWSPRYAWALPALLLAILWMVFLPSGVQGATSYKVLYSIPLSAAPQPVPVSPSGLLVGADGNFYGTTYYGGTTDLGSLFELPYTGPFTTLYSFKGQTDGVSPSPAAGLIQGSDGNFYGTTHNGGPDDLGTIFKLTWNQIENTFSLTTLYAFTMTGAEEKHPQGSLVRDPDGTLYGTTTVGGAPGYGTLFRLTTTGTLTTLHAFTGPDGAYPQAGLLRDSDGTFYGTTLGDGSSNYGTVFKLTPNGSDFLFSPLHTFTGPDGAYPQGNLLPGADGTLYGTTYSGGAANMGTVFKLAPTGTLTTLHTFTGSDGAYPQAGLVLGLVDENLYGTTFGTCIYGEACTSGYGTVFTLAADGSAFTTLHTFDGANGANPQTPVIQGSDTYFYGTTSHGGSTTGGVIFVLRVGNPVTVTVVGNGTVTIDGGTGISSCATICTEVFPAQVSIVLNAVPATGYKVTWSGDCTGTESCSISMATAQNVTATFTPQTFALTVQKAGTGTGTVTSAPTGITCGTACSKLFDYNTLVTLTATATSPSVFTGWSGAGCSGLGTCVVTLTQARTVTATFAPPLLPLTVTIAGSSLGIVSSTPPGIACSASCTTNFAANTPVTLTATAEAGGTFKGWRGACTGAGACVVPMSGAKSVTVVFAKTFIDGTLTAGSTPIKAVHFTELREAINALRINGGLLAFNWIGAPPASGGTVSAAHLTSLRIALTAAYVAAHPGSPGPTYTDPTVTGGTTPIKVAHLSELRTLVRALE